MEINTPAPAQPPAITWDTGTAYDLFISLAVLHNPARFGQRPSWAAGVRSRLPSEARQTLETASALFAAPLSWLAGLPPPKDAGVVLRSLAGLPAPERLPALATQYGKPGAVLDVLSQASAAGHRDEHAIDALRAAYRQQERPTPPPAVLPNLLAAWADLAGFGERYLFALQTYVDVFYAEEEQRLAPRLLKAVEQAQELAGRLALPDLLEQLSQGVRFALPQEGSELILAPSYWSAPLVFIASIGPNRLAMVFGARPAGLSLAPGDAIPDALLNTLKTLADPSRLKILHFLSQQPLAPAEIARKLRLRPPTVTHHLAALRLAGLVSIQLDANEERRYTLRREAIQALGPALSEYLQGVDHHDPNKESLF